MHKVLVQAKANLQKAQEQMMAQANKHRRPYTFTEGQQVMLATVNLSLPQTSLGKKLKPKWLGPFKIVHVISDVAVQLELPSTMRICTVCYA